MTMAFPLPFPERSNLSPDDDDGTFHFSSSLFEPIRAELLNESPGGGGRRRHLVGGEEKEAHGREG